MNTQLAQKVLDRVLLNPSQHNQDIYGHTNSCGTTACLAGWTLLESGEYELVGEENFRHIPTGSYAPSPSLEAAYLLDVDSELTDEIFYKFDNTLAIKRFERLIATDGKDNGMDIVG